MFSTYRVLPKPWAWLLLMMFSMQVVPVQASDWTRDDGYFKATSYNDHIRFEVLLCDLYSTNTYSKGGYIQAVSGGEVHNLIYLEYAYNSDDPDSNPTAPVKAYISHTGGKAWFDVGTEITTSNQTFTLKKWDSDKDYLTAYIDYYFPADLSGKTWNIQYKYTHSNGSEYTMSMNSSCEFKGTLGVSSFDAGDYTCERISPSKMKLTVPKLPTYSGKADDVREWFCDYDVTYTFTYTNTAGQDATATATGKVSCEKNKQANVETEIPAAVGNPKQIDVNITARQGMKDPTGEFWHQTDKYYKAKAFKVVPQPSDLTAGYRQFDTSTDLTWAQPVDTIYLKSIPYVYSIETNEQGEKLSGKSWHKCDALDWAANKKSLSYTVDGVPIGHYYKYLVLNVPEIWTKNTGTTGVNLSSPSDELISRLGGQTSDVLSTIPDVRIYDLEQDTTVTNKVRLTWKYSRVPVGGSEVKFQVLRKTSTGGQWTEFGQTVTADANPAAGTIVAIEDSTLANVSTRYTYKVRLSLENGKYVFESGEVTAGLLRGTLLKDFEASKGAHEKEVTLTWNASKAGTGKDTYRIWRRYADSGDDFQFVKTVNDENASGSYNDGNAQPGYYYEYKLEVYSGDVLQNTLYDIGFTQSRGVVSGHVAFNSASTTSTPVEDVRISLQSSDTGVGNTVTDHSMRVNGASTGIQWDADSTTTAKLFGPDKNFTVQMFVRPDSLLSEGAVIGEIPGEGRLVLGKQTNGDYELMLQKLTPAISTPEVIDLSKISEHYTAKHGDILTGTLSYHILRIPNDATVMLRDATINGYSGGACIYCQGNATIILEGTNTANSSSKFYPGILNNGTLTINGMGTLNATGGNAAAGIGGGSQNECGDINILGGTINATSNLMGAAIGSGYGKKCGNITISGGVINAVSSRYGAAIGTGSSSICGSITITNTVTSVTATKGSNAPRSIGKGDGGSCGTVTIGGTVYSDGISDSPYTYDEGDGSWADNYELDDIFKGHLIPDQFVYGTATATGIKLTSNTYSLLTVSRTGDNLQFQVNDSDTKTLTATKQKYLAPFSVGGANDIKTEQAFKGYLAEVRVWDHVLTDEEKKSNNDRILSGREKGLKLYWPLDEGLDRYAFDASYTNDLSNGRHATVGGNISSSTILPTREQLSRYGVTDKNGDYTIVGIPYVGGGTTYVATPTKGIHVFEPQSRSGYIGNGSLTLNGYDFTDKSSFPMRGKVAYQYTNIPVDSVQFKIDGSLQQVWSDSNGEYELNVPIGSHRIEAFKNGHHLTGFPLAGGTWDFKKAETVNFVDSTLVNVTGRINGGFSDKDAPVGFKQSKNRIGQATLKLSLGKDTQCSFNYVTDNEGNADFGTTDLPVASATTNIQSTSYRAALKTDNKDTYYIYIKTDPETGEFSALLPPLKYKVESIRFAGTDNPYNDASVFTQNLPVIDATTVVKESMKSDTLPGSSQKYEYSAKMMRQYRSETSISVAQTGFREGVFGERRVIITNTDNSTDSVTVLTLTPTDYTYRFKYPIFRQGRSYNLGIDVVEHYKNYDTNEEFDEIPQDACVRIINDGSATSTVFGAKGSINGEEIEMGMPYETMQINVKPDKQGHVDYTFEAGWPNFADGHLLNMSISAQVDGRTTVWKAPGKNRSTALDMIVLGSISTGTNFVTEGPSVVDMILRRPPGSSSVASLENKEIKSYVKTNVTSTGRGNTYGAYISEAPTWKVSVGNVMGIATLTDSKSTIVANETLTGNYSWNDATVTGSDSTYTTTMAMTTPASMQYVNEHEAFEPEGGDTYIGRSTNLLFSKGRMLGIFKDGDDYVIGDKEGITVGQQFSTSFVLPQAYILNTLIPNWEAIIRDRLTTGHIDADHTVASNCPKIDGKVMYYTKYKPGDEKFGTGNADGSVWTDDEIKNAGGCPSYRLVNGTGNQVEDEVQIAINSIKAWRNVIADNEQEKVEAINGGATKIDNYSIANSTKVSRSTFSSLKKNNGATHTYDYVLNAEAHVGYMFNDAGAYAIVRSADSNGTSEKNDTTTTHERTVAWTMADGDYRTALSVDVFESNNGWGPIFITRGGQTANPYEGETRTMFYEPDTKLNEATMQVELPQLKVMGAAELTDIPTGTQAQFNLQLTNMSETNDICTYTLEVKENSNPNGAILTVDGNILSNGKDGRNIRMKGGETIEKMLIVTQSQKNIIDYDDIVLVLKSQNDRTVSSEPVKLHVHFVPSSTPVDLSVNHTVLNKAVLDEVGGITATMYNLDRQSDDLQGLRLRYRRKGEATWTLHKEWTTIDSLVTNDILAMPEGSQIHEHIAFSTDGIYEVQAQTYGLYGTEEVTYESTIVEITQDTHGPKLLGMVSPEDGRLTMENRNNMHVRFNEVLNGNALSKSENFRIEGGMNNVVFGGEGNPYPDVAVQLNGNSIETDAMYDLSDSDCAFDMWFYRQGDGTIISLGTGNNLLALSTHDDGMLRARVGGEEDVFETGAQLPKDEWMYMALNYKRKTADDPKNRISMLYVTADDKTPHYIGEDMEANDLNGNGKLGVGGDGMQGMISKLSIWNSDITATDLYETRNNVRASYTPGLVGYWTMDEGHGTQLTDRARSRHMYMDSESWYINNENRAASLDGTKPIRVDIATFNPAKTDNYALEFWFRGNKPCDMSDQTLVSVLNGISIGCEGPLQGHDVLVLKKVKHSKNDAGAEIQETEEEIQLSNKDYKDGNWHHFALNVRRGTSAIAYIDGEAVKVIPEEKIPGISGKWMLFGGEELMDTNGEQYAMTYNHFTGDIDEIRIWGAALDGGLIKDRMYERMDNNYPGLAGYFPMEEIHRTVQGTVVTDFSPANFGETDYKDRLVIAESASLTQSVNAPALKPGSTNMRMDDSQFDFTASSDEIYFSFPDGSLPLMDNNDFTATVSYIKDEHGNNSEPVQWMFHADFAAVSWELDDGKAVFNYEKNRDETVYMYLGLVNKTGASQPYEITGLPTWLTTDEAVGTVESESKYISFTIAPTVSVGRHTEYLYVTDRLGIQRVMQLNLTVRGDEPEWSVDPNLYESNMTLTGQIYINDKICENSDTKIAAFDEMGICRGVGYPRYVSTRDAYYVDMILYGASATELSTGERELSFKIYDASTGNIHPLVLVKLPGKDGDFTMRYVPDASYGSYNEPVELRVSNVFEEPVSLAKGWTWMSIYVDPVVADIASVLPKDATILKRFKNIKSQTAFASVNSSGQIFGELATIEPGKMYKMQLSTKTDFEVYGIEIDVANTSQTIHPGYNWIGSLSNRVMSPEDAFAELSPAPGDRIKNRTSFAEYSKNGIWEGTLESIVPGQGYIYQSKATEDKTFHYPSHGAGANMAPSHHAPHGTLTEGAAGAMHFRPVDPYLYPDNMSIIGVVKKDGKERDDAEVGAVINGECRGAVGYNSGYYFLTIMGSSEDDADAKMELRVFIDGEEYMVNDQLPFISDAFYGSLDEPFVLDVDATAIRTVGEDSLLDDTEWYTLQGYKIGRKPTRQGVYIHNGKKVTIKRKK